MAPEISTGKSICILGTVIACFAVLWPNIFYPMLKGSVSVSSDGCCDVLLDKDVNGVKLVNELCSTVLRLSDKFNSDFYFSSNRLDKDAVKYCRNVVLETCDIDINALLKDTIELDLKYKNVLEDIRTFNKSLCLKYHFDITLDLLGTPHRVKKFNVTTITNYYRQERKSRAKEALHPAFRKVTPPNRKALPDVDPSAIYHDEDILPPPIAAMQHEPLPGKKPPIPGMRPTVGGNGYIAQQKGSGTMGILMPMYTIGIVAFFTYTILKLLSKKPENRSNFIHDPDFCQNVFSNNDPHEKTTSNTAVDPASKLVMTAMSSLLQEVNRDILERDKNDYKDEADVEQPNENGISSNAEAIVIDKVNDDNDIKTEKLNGVIKVVGMELNESCENGKPWTRSPSSPTTKTEPVPPPPHEIMLPGNVPVNSQILVSDAHTENVSNESSVILESKVTLNVISPDLENGKEMDKSEINGVVHNGNGEGSGVIVNGGDSAQEEEEDEEVEVEEEEEEEIEVEEEEEEEIEVEEEEEEEIEVEDESEIDYDNNKVIVNKNVENIDKSGVEDRNTEL